ncbi:hypothetical protein [Loigolactobacillus rennini]|uniref:Uncharacterized protein n=1 Tax=Loigolactobacillus rennini DSM 20253 TaxID=1423796 RepID=A0A0R2CY17_9LACO|nr:hypothetical protein [Loigolactobacillus rennini]KRM92873.1 hypothetical protein FC24_GL000890 [Loigolactobacillus rennini DSM 20253]
MADKRPIEQRVADHENRIEHIEDSMRDLKDDLSKGLQRVDESNRYLRNQNGEILREIIKRNNVAEQHDYTLKKMSKTNQIKMFTMIFGASGLAFALIELLLKFL